MKKELQPKINTVTVECVTCGNKFKLNTTSSEIKVDVCSNCHPFYTGKLASGSKAGRIEKFNQKFGKKN